MLDPIELAFYITEIVLLTAIFALEFMQFKKEDAYMNGHKGTSALKPFVAQVESEDSDL